MGPKRKRANSEDPYEPEVKASMLDELPVRNLRQRRSKQQVIEEKKNAQRRRQRSSFASGRIKRALKQRMFLLEVEQLAEQWKFVVEGSQGIPYDVRLAVNDISCNCHDFRTNNHNEDEVAACKHLYFIIFRVAQISEESEVLVDGSLNENQFEMVSQCLRNRLKTIIKKPESEEKQDKQEKPELGQDKDCAICFEQLSEKDSLKQCAQCRKYFHKECLGVWLRRNANCPMCRFDMNKKEISDEPLDGTDALGKLKMIHME